MSYTLSDVIEQVRRLTMPRPPMSFALLAAYTLGQTQLTLDYNNPNFNAIRVGSIIAVDLELFYVTGEPNTSTGVTNVAFGYYGSVNAAHANGALAEVNPRFSRWEISKFVNEELNALSNPSTGLGQILRVTPAFIPVFVGYDLGGASTDNGYNKFDQLRSRVLEVSFRIAPPVRTYPLIRRGEYRVIRQQDPAQSDFPSGNGIIIYRTAWPGFPITVQFTAPYAALVNLTDDVETVAGMVVSQNDILYMGTALRMVPDREIQRNTLDAQQDPRKPPEVPPNAIAASANALYTRYLRRIGEERAFFKRAYPHAEWV